MYSLFVSYFRMENMNPFALIKRALQPKIICMNILQFFRKSGFRSDHFLISKYQYRLKYTPLLNITFHQCFILAIFP